MFVGVAGLALFTANPVAQAEPPDLVYAREYRVQPAPIRYETYVRPAREVVYVESRPTYSYGGYYGSGCATPSVVYAEPSYVYARPAYGYVGIGVGYSGCSSRPAYHHRSYYPRPYYPRPYYRAGHHAQHYRPVHHGYGHHPSHGRGWSASVGGGRGYHGGYGGASFNYRR